MRKIGIICFIAVIWPLMAGCGMTLVKNDDLAKLQSDNSNYSEALVDLRNEVQAQNAQLTKAQDDRDMLQKKVDSMMTDLKNSKNLIDSTKGTLGKQIAGLNSQIKVKDQTIASLKDDISNKGSEISTMRLNIKGLSDEKDKILTQQDLEKANLEQTSSNLMKQMRDEIASGNLKIRQMGDELNIDFQDKIFFDSGSANIKGNGKIALDRLAESLKNITNKQIRVEGYTDNVPIADMYLWKYPSNWELSTSRATTIVRYLQSKGIDPRFLKATGYGEYNPIAPNDTEENRAKNRRIVVLLVPLDERSIFK